MNLSGSTSILVNGKPSRICGHVFNAALRACVNRDGTTRDGTAPFVVLDAETCSPIVPSKGLDWATVGKMIRAGKKVQASVEGKTKAKPRKSKTTSLYGLEPEGENV